MLQQLYIKNYILIRELDISFFDGFTVITGETGAGKSIFLGALSLLLGDRADTSVISDKNQKCIIEGTFLINELLIEELQNNIDADFSETIIIRREINPNGKSRAFVNDTPVGLAELRSFTEKLVDIHSQHSTLFLSKTSFQLFLVDTIAGNKELLQNYKSTFNLYQLTNAELEKKSLILQQLEKESDYNSFLLKEIEEINPGEDEIENLEHELFLSENAEKIKQTLTHASDVLSDQNQNILQQLTLLISNLGYISDNFSTIQQIKERLSSCKIELTDIASEINSINQKTTIDPEQTDTVRKRMDRLNHLLHKHKVSSIEELRFIEKNLIEQFTQISDISHEISNLEKEKTIHLKKLSEYSETLSQRRKLKIPEIVDTVKTLLQQLGIPFPQFKIELTTIEDFNNQGKDRILFYFSANKGEQLAELSKIASGGEMSRIMLALKSIMAINTMLPTLILDEIDTGISGEIARKTAEILKKMGTSMQCIVISHLPQIAAKSSHHILVSKRTSEEKTFTEMNYLQSDSRISELAKMLSGNNVTESSINTAKELMN